jgi:hypothetical protein
METCPFKVGDTVYYRPSVHGYGWSVMTSPEGQPSVGQAVKISNIVDGLYVEWEGLAHPAGGIYWTEFCAKP